MMRAPSRPMRLALQVAVILGLTGVVVLAESQRWPLEARALTHNDRLESHAVRLVVRPRRASPGQKIRLRLENHSRGAIGYGEEFSVQKRSSVGWLTVSFPHPLSGEVLYTLRPGRASWWLVVEVPRRTEAGWYRIVKPIEVGGKSSRRVSSFHVGG
jgi:hypothetical protein